MQPATAIQFACPKCGAQYQAGAEKVGLSGATFTCRKCGHAILIEKPTERPATDREQTRVYPQAELAVRLMEERAAARAEHLHGPALQRREWFVGVEGKPAGPLAFADLETRAAEGKLSAGMLVWKEGMISWKPAAEVPELVPLVAKSIVGPPPPPPPEEITQPDAKKEAAAKTGDMDGTATPATSPPPAEHSVSPVFAGDMDVAATPATSPPPAEHSVSPVFAGDMDVAATPATSPPPAEHSVSPVFAEPAPTDIAKIEIAAPAPAAPVKPVVEEPKIAISETMAVQLKELGLKPPPPLPEKPPEPAPHAVGAVEAAVKVERESREKRRAAAVAVKLGPGVRVARLPDAARKAPNVLLWAAVGLGVVLVSGIAMWFLSAPASEPSAVEEPEVAEGEGEEPALAEVQLTPEQQVRSRLSRAKVNRCIREQRARTAGRRGELRMSFRVKPDGAPHEIQASTASDRGTSFASCLAGAIRDARFPDHAGQSLSLDFAW
jgi:predicted Zn finger-like uncharacterized protein